MSKRTIALIVGLSLITILLLTIAVNPKKEQRTPTLPPVTTPSQTVQPTQEAATTRMFLSPNQVVTSTTTNSVDVMVESDENSLTAVQLELQYDPKAISSITVKPGTFFDNPVVLLNTVDKTTGRVSYALGILPSQTTKKGSGTVATISFTLTGTVNSTTLSFLPKSLATAAGVPTSVLKETLGTTITLTRNTPPSQGTVPSSNRTVPSSAPTQ